jgi:hypothetical protein
MKCTYARATFHFSEQFSESIREMIADGELTNEQEIKDYIKDCLLEDIADHIEHARGSELDELITYDFDLE